MIYVTDKDPGFSRKRIGRKFNYFGVNYHKIKDKKILSRIKSLAIPPAWTSVWVCKNPDGHIQATGQDHKGRKQYRYHNEWIKISQQTKFNHLENFAKSLPLLRNKVANHLSLPKIPKNKVLATVVWLLENTLIRIGNMDYEKNNQSYGLTTLKDKHVNIKKENIKFSFKGKSGIYHEVTIKNKKVAKIIKECQELPGQDLFEYKDKQNKLQKITSSDVNTYLRKISGKDITAKDFRTWAGSKMAIDLLDHEGISKNQKQAKKVISKVVKKVANNLKNKPNTCRKYYIHPDILKLYKSGYTRSNLHTHPRHNSYQNLISSLS